MLRFLQVNWGTIVALLAVAFIVFLAIRTMVLDKKAGIGICGQKCAQCAKMGHCAEEKAEEAQSSMMCGRSCSGCQYSNTCHHS